MKIVEMIFKGEEPKAANLSEEAMKAVTDKLKEYEEEKAKGNHIDPYVLVRDKDGNVRVLAGKS